MTGNEQATTEVSAVTSHRPRQWLLVLWPAFLAACLLEALVFSMVDPNELHWFGHALQSGRQAIYSMAFFAFWLISMVCSGLVLWLAAPYRFAAQKVQ